MGKSLIVCDWESVPHLTEAMKTAQLKDMDPHLRDARSRGIPFLGAGAVYPVLTSIIEVAPFAIPDHWPRGFGLDVGYNMTGAIWGAINPENDVLYLYDEHYVAEETPATHAYAIMGYGTKGNNRAKWIPGVIDPASKGRQQADGVQLLESYKNLGLDLETAINAVDSGIYQVWMRLSSGRLKVFSSLQYFFKEYLLYRRIKKEDGKVLIRKKNDHIMDALRYLVMSGIERMKPVPYIASATPEYGDPYSMSGTSWMAS